MNRRNRPLHSRRRKQQASTRFGFEELESKRMLAPLLPDLFAWESESRGYLHDYRIEGNLLRFSTALANSGEGALEIRGGAVTGPDTQEVFQRIYDDDGSWTERLAGEFTYHAGHNHIHFDGYAIYNLREQMPDGSVGDIVASGGKVSFCLIDISRYDPDAGSSNYGSCGAEVQGITAGWSDVYGSSLPDQWIDITGIADGDYFLEVIVDPYEQLEESDETNNTTIIPVTIVDGPGIQGDRFEPNNTFTSAANWGAVSSRQEAGISVHVPTDVDYYQFLAAGDGDFDVQIDFTHSLGNLDLFVYDVNQNLVASSTSTDDLEEVSFPVLANELYFIKVEGVNGETNAYEIDLHGPGEISTVQVDSNDAPIAIPDGTGSGQAGQTITSTLEGPNFVITDLNTTLNDLAHTWVSDLSFSLTSPNGTTVDFIKSQYEPGGGNSDSNGDNFVNTVIDDQAPTNFADGTAPFTGSYNVEDATIVNNPMSVFNGENALGTWTLSITDWHNADTGTLNSWGILFTGIDQNPGDRFESNEDFPQAVDYNYAGFIHEHDLSIHRVSDVDFFRFKPYSTTNVQFDIEFLHDNGNLDVAVYDETLETIYVSNTVNDNESFSLLLEADELYYVKVYSDENAINDYELTIDAPVQFGESGLVNNLTHEWQTISLTQSYIDPVIVMGTASFIGADPITLSVQNVTSNSFDVRINEWNYLNDTHIAESASFMVMEHGTHTLADGTLIEAGHVDFDHQWSTANFSFGFTDTPIVLTQTGTQNGADAMTPRHRNVTAKGFELRIQEEENGNQLHTTETLGWVAIQPATGTIGSSLYEAGTTGDAVTHADYELNFATSFGSTPNLFTTMQTFDGPDTATVRGRSVGTAGATIFLEEEKSKNNETNHTTEAVGYFATNADILWSRIESTPTGNRGSDHGGDDHDHRDFHGGDETGFVDLTNFFGDRFGSPTLASNPTPELTRLHILPSKIKDLTGADQMQLQEVTNELENVIDSVFETADSESLEELLAS